MTERKDDGVTYDEDGYPVYTGLSPLSEDDDEGDES